MRAAGIAGYSQFCCRAPFVDTNWLSRDWWIGESCLYNVKIRVRVLAVSDFRDHVKIRGWMTGQIFFLIWSYFYWAIVCDARAHKKATVVLQLIIWTTQVVACVFKWWVIICVSEFLPLSWLCMCDWRTTRVRVVNNYPFEGFSLLSSQFLKHSLFPLCILSSLSRALFCPQILPLFPVSWHA